MGGSLSQLPCVGLRACGDDGDQPSGMLHHAQRGKPFHPPPLARTLGGEEGLLLEVARFLHEESEAFSKLCAASSPLAKLQAGSTGATAWREMYAERWPSFFECLSFQGATDWQRLYRETQAGSVECVLEVFDRQKKVGFAMSAMPAVVGFSARGGTSPELVKEGRGCYVARYLSASSVQPEMIPISEEHRLRFCPASARPQLRPSAPPVALPPVEPEEPRDAAEETAQEYPNKVLEGFEGLQVGAKVELQWKMQQGSPFGWWFGQLDELSFIDGGLARGTITFRHFSATSPWYSLSITFGDSQVRECHFGGFTGGVRAVSDWEQKQAMRFFPPQPIDF